ncbi:MAG: hypothetical protein V3V08_05445 [Nannocystaceae bacterium]
MTDEPSQSFQIDLEGETVTLTLRYQTLPDDWLLGIEREDEPILEGQRLVMGTDLLRAHNFGLGGIVLFAAEEPGKDPGRNDLEDRVQIVHLTEAEIAAISA